jgi:hypothetical protein
MTIIRHHLWSATVLAALALVTACSDSGGPESQDPPESPEPPGLPTPPTAAIVEGSNFQVALRGTVLPKPLRLKVTFKGAPMPGVSVAWEVSAGSLQLTSSRTDNSGVASATWVLGPTPGPMTVVATVEGASGPPLTFAATALPLITMVVDPTSDGQTGVAGAALPRPLRVQVFSESRPFPGATVQWTGSGTSGFSPTTSVTDPDGFATAVAILPTAWGPVVIRAATNDSGGASAAFQAIALPGPGTTISKSLGDGHSAPANFPVLGWVGVNITDQYGNPSRDQDVEWSVVSGPVGISRPGGTNAEGHAYALVTLTGTVGLGVVRASLPGGLMYVDFTLTAEPPVPLVYLNGYFPGGFISRNNGSQPAVDTLPVGGTMTWLIEPFDYEDHGVVSVGSPSFSGGGDFPWGAPLKITFPDSGTYRYADPYYPGLTGTIVVR